MFFRRGSLDRIRTRLSSAVLAFTVLATACSAPALQEPGAGTPVTVEPQSGSVKVKRGSETSAVRTVQSLSPGDRVEVPEDEVARISAGRDRTLQLRGGSLLMISPSTFRLISGRVLVRTLPPTRIESGFLQVSGGGSVFRVDKQLGTRVANYEGQPVTVRSQMRSLSISPFRQVVTVQGVLPSIEEPLRFSVSDRWDRSLLSGAIDLNERISNFAQGLEAQLGTNEGLDFLTKVAPSGLGGEFFRPYLTSRRSDLLIGLSMSAEAVKLQDLAPDLRFAHIFRLWSRGASWGLLAQEFGVRPDALFRQLTQAVGRARIQVIGAGPGLSRPEAGAFRVPAKRNPVRRPPAPAPGTLNTPASRPTPSPSAVVPPAVRGAVPDPVEGIVDDLLGVTDPVTDLPPVL